MAESARKARSVRVLFGWMSIGVGAAALSTVFLGGAAYGYEQLYANKMYPGVRVAGVRVGGLTKQEARLAVEQTIDAALANGLRFSYHGKEAALAITDASTSPDASRDLIRYSIDDALDAAFAFGRTGGVLARFSSQSRLRVVPANLLPEIRFDRSAILDALQLAYRGDLSPPQNARYQADMTAVPPAVSILSEREGVELVMDAAFRELQGQAERLDFRLIVLNDQTRSPKITRADLLPLLPGAEAFLRRPAVQLTYEDSTFKFPAALFSGWLSVTGSRDAPTLTIDPQAFAESVRTVAGSVEQDAKNGSLVVKDGKIASFVAGIEGREIDTEATRKNILAHWPASSTFPLVVIKTHGTLLGEDPTNLGITDLLGVGKSNFSGSPVNRRKNIAHGVALVNGTLIPPGETFSLLTTLGPVDQSHKWLPELVIKGNETKPEFGGGLCQIGTTTFRGALASGLPIVERQNHSYRVRYYEPAGTDATIYEPRPDFRFLNDTNSHILINAYAKGDDIFFEFWGTKDGRIAEQTKPVISNVVSPPPMKLIETLDLPPGKKKCTETAHAGADASFTYTVTMPSGEVKKETFRSHYRPWQAVCLIGVETLSAPPDSASSTVSVGSAAVN